MSSVNLTAWDSTMAPAVAPVGDIPRVLRMHHSGDHICLSIYRPRLGWQRPRSWPVPVTVWSIRVAGTISVAELSMISAKGSTRYKKHIRRAGGGGEWDASKGGGAEQGADERGWGERRGVTWQKDRHMSLLGALRLLTGRVLWGPMLAAHRPPLPG